METAYIYDCEIAIDSHNFPDWILDIVSEDLPPLNRIDTLNNLAKQFEEMGNKDI